MEVGLPGESDREGGGSGFAVALEAEAAQHGVEFAQVAGMEIDGERRGAGERVCAQAAVRRELAGGQVQLELAQIDCAVALRVGCVDDAGGGGFAGERMSRGSSGSSVAATERVRVSPLDQVAVAGPLTRAPMPRRWKGGWLTMSRMVSSVTSLNWAVTLPLTGMGDRWRAAGAGIAAGEACAPGWRLHDGLAGHRRRARD